MTGTTRWGKSVVVWALLGSTTASRDHEASTSPPVSVTLHSDMANSSRHAAKGATDRIHILPGDGCHPGIRALFCPELDDGYAVTLRILGKSGVRGLLLHHGQPVFVGPVDFGLSISMARQGQEFILQTTRPDGTQLFDDTPVAARGNELCGASGFPEGERPDLLCDPAGVTVTIPELHTLEDPRGFGLEAEYTSLPPADLVDLATVNFDGSAFVGDAAEVNEQKRDLRRYIQEWLQQWGAPATWRNIYLVLNSTEGTWPTTITARRSLATMAINPNLARVLSEKHRNWLLQTIGVPMVKRCFDAMYKGVRPPGHRMCTRKCRCDADNDCQLTHFCSNDGFCIRRELCRMASPRNAPKRGNCLYPLSTWSWLRDNSVTPMTANQVERLIEPRIARGLLTAKAGGILKAHNRMGIGFEVVSSPMSGSSGLRSLVEITVVLDAMGIQVGPSGGVHVHANAISRNVPGELLTLRGIANVWVQWAKFQLVIDEFMSPSRVGSPYASRHIASPCKDNLEYAAGADGVHRLVVKQDMDSHHISPETVHISGCKEKPYMCIRRIFRNLHGLVRSSGTLVPDMTDADFMRSLCSTMLDTSPDDGPSPCEAPYPHQRYFQLNLVPLFTHGTLEVRVHASTKDPDRMQRWVKFVLAFIRRFGLELSSDEFFSGSDWTLDFSNLRDQQLRATFDHFVTAMSPVLPLDELSYFHAREWEQEAPGRKTPECEWVGEPDIIELGTHELIPSSSSERSLYQEDETSNREEATVYEGRVLKVADDSGQSS